MWQAPPPAQIFLAVKLGYNTTSICQVAQQMDLFLNCANNGSGIIRTTYLGTGSYDAIYGIKFDKLGFPYVMGITEDANGRS